MFGPQNSPLQTWIICQIMKHDEKRRAITYLRNQNYDIHLADIKTGRIPNYRCTSSNLNTQAITKQNPMHSNRIAILIKNTQYILTAILLWSKNHPEHSQSNTLKIEELVRIIFLMTWNIAVFMPAALHAADPRLHCQVQLQPHHQVCRWHISGRSHQQQRWNALQRGSGTAGWMVWR